jgi:hypothetical protein
LKDLHTASRYLSKRNFSGGNLIVQTVFLHPWYMGLNIPFKNDKLHRIYINLWKRCCRFSYKTVWLNGHIDKILLQFTPFQEQWNSPKQMKLMFLNVNHHVFLIKTQWKIPRLVFFRRFMLRIDNSRSKIREITS